MKRNLFGIAALVLAIAISSFTKKAQEFYLVYDLSQQGVEKSINSYDAPVTADPGRQIGTGEVNWLKVEDTDNNSIISNTEFDTSFEIADVTNDSNDLLSDEATDRDRVDVMAP